jgi:putative spermidine/putrescine transport system substrate-binding protein
MDELKNNLGTLLNARRRDLLRTGGVALAVVTAAQIGVSHRAFGAEKVVIRTTSGGTYGDAMEKAIYAPFTKATGIVVEKTPVEMAPLIASAKQGQPLVDVIDTSEGLLETLSTNNVLTEIDYNRFKAFTVQDIGTEAAMRTMVRRMVYARVLGYRKSAFSKTPAPRSWADFWDVQKFPGARALPGLGLATPDLEFALIADGVPAASLYPLDIPRALASYSKIRAHVQSFYGTDAISANLLSTGEIDLEPIANGRIQPMVDEGRDCALEWNQHMKVPSGYAILQGTRNLDNAYRFIDFAMSPEIQASFATLIPYGPVNSKAFKTIPEQFAEKLPTNPKWSDQGFTQDAQWWGMNLPQVTKAWNEWSSK